MTNLNTARATLNRIRTEWHKLEGNLYELEDNLYGLENETPDPPFTFEELRQIWFYLRDRWFENRKDDNRYVLRQLLDKVRDVCDEL